MGIGGGCVMIIYSKFIIILKIFELIISFRKHGKSFSIVEREAAPLYSNRRLYLEKENLSLIGILDFLH
jgi:hypothetical protein